MARSAIVVGGGLATARALLATGWDVTVLEQASALAPVGAGLGLAPNGVRALDWLGLGEELRSRGMAQGPAGIRTASGRWLLRTRFEELQRRVGVPTFAVHRADLHRMLAKAVDDAVLRTGHEGQAARHDGDRATVSYRSPDGLGHASADLVVAADGVHSRLRTTLFPEHPGVTYAGYVTWRGVVRAASAGGE